MPPTLHTHSATAPDGRRVTVSCRSKVLQEEWFWHTRMTSRTLAIGVSVASPDYADHSIERNEYTVQQTVTYRGRPLVVALAPDADGYLVAWKGPHHSVVFGGAGNAPRLGDLTDLLDQFAITDTPDGLQLRPQPGSGVIMWGIFAVKFADAGMITAYPREDATALIPDQPGLRVERGTVWKKTLDNGTGMPGHAKYLHAGDGAVCMIDDDFGRDPGVTLDGQEELLSSLTVHWSR